MKRYALGLDYGTNSCRALLVDLQDGREVAQSVFPYPSGEAGILLDSRNPHLARQNPQDYLDGLVASVREALAQAWEGDPHFDPAAVIGIGIDTTGSTPIPVDGQGLPLGLKPEFKDNLAAMVWLWRDHTAHAEAGRITALAREFRPRYLERCGGAYSSEWFWSKILHCRRTAPQVFEAAHSWVELCDYLPAVLTGNTQPEAMARSRCAAGHKALYAPEWGGLPDKEFLSRLDPALAHLRDRLYSRAMGTEKPAGRLSPEWADRLGLGAGTTVAVGAFDAHMGAVGAGVREGTLVKIIGTSTCDIMVRRGSGRVPHIPGVCGVVDGSVMEGWLGVEAGQSGVGDIFLWFVNRLVPETYGRTIDEKFAGLEKAAQGQEPGGHGLLALDWNNGNRTILVDARLTGLLVGQTLHTEAHEIYRALLEGTAFGALRIIERLEEYGMPVREVINCGGLADKSAMLMQIYADVTGRPMKLSASDQTCALGAALFGAVAAGKEAGGFASVAEAQQALCAVRDKVYAPAARGHETYRRLYGLYKDLHDAFGTTSWSGRLGHVMKELIALREQASAGAGR